MGSNRRLLLGGKSDLVLSASKYSIKAGSDSVTLTTKLDKSDVTSSATYTVTYNRTHNDNKNVISFPSLGTTVTSNESINIQAKYNGLLSNIVTITREANVITSTVGGVTNYGSITAGSINEATIPASGGTKTTTIGNGSQSWSRTEKVQYYTSGSSTVISESASGTSSVSPNITSLEGTAGSKGTTESGITVVKSATINWTANSKTVSGTAHVYQAANTYSDSGGNITYGDITIGSISDDTIPASGGTGEAVAYNGYISYTASGTTRTWSSGATETLSTSNSGRETVYPNPSTFSKHAPSKGTTISGVTEVGHTTITWSAHGKSKTGTAYIYQAENKIVDSSTSGGSYTYGDVVAGNINNEVIPAKGGSATSTAGSGTQSWSRSAIYTTYEYSSGSTESEKTSDTTSGSYSISPSPSNLQATAGTKGTTTSSQNIVKQTTVTWSGYGGKSKSGTMCVYQEKNEVVSTSTSGGEETYSDITGYNVTDYYIPASGGEGDAVATNGKQTITTSKSTITYTYTSGATSSSTSGNSSTRTIDVTPVPSKLHGKATSRGVTAGTKKEIEKVIAKWTSGGVEKAHAMYVYQDANELLSTSYGVLSFGNTSRNAYSITKSDPTYDKNANYSSGESSTTRVTAIITSAKLVSCITIDGVNITSMSVLSSSSSSITVTAPNQYQIRSATVSLTVTRDGSSQNETISM